MDKSIYQEHGYANRMEYLKDMADEHGLSLATVLACAQLLGPDEDFDGLINALEDAEAMGVD